MMNQWTPLDEEAVRRTRDLGSFKLPRREAPRVEVEAVDDAVPAELNLELERIPRGQLAAHCTHRSASKAAEQTVWVPQGQPLAPDGVASLISEPSLVWHTRLAYARVNDPARRSLRSRALRAVYGRKSTDDFDPQGRRHNTFSRS
jgi:hypothetical protein